MLRLFRSVLITCIMQSALLKRINNQNWLVKRSAVIKENLQVTITGGRRQSDRHNLGGPKIARFNKVVIQNNKLQVASGQRSQWFIESPTIVHLRDNVI